MAVLGPHLAGSYISIFLGETLKKLTYQSRALIEEKGSFEMLDILHHLSAGFKAYMTEYAYIAMDEMRQACGGAGFHSASGVSLNFQNGAPLTTFDGVNTVMMQQSSRLLLKKLKLIAEGKKCEEGYMAYLNDTETILQFKSKAQTTDDFLQIGHLAHALAVRSVFQLK